MHFKSYLVHINPETHSCVCLFPKTDKFYLLFFFVIFLEVNVHEEFGVKSILIIRTNYANLFEIIRMYPCKVLNIRNNKKLCKFFKSLKSFKI